MKYLNFNSFIEKTKESVVNEASFDAEELYNEIKKDRKTKMISDIDDGSILFYHKDVQKGKAEVNVNGYDGDITIEVPGGPYGSGEWYGEPVENMKDIDKQIKSYIKAEKSGEFETMEESVVNEDKFGGIADLTKSLHFEMDPKTAEEKKIELGKRQGEVTKRKQIEGGDYSLRRFRKEIKYGDGTYLGVFIPGSYDAAVSSLGDGPHAKKVKKVKWNQRKYDKWISDLAYDNDGVGQGSSYGFEMAQNAKHEPGLIDFVKRSNRGEDPLQRIQWDIEAAMESVVTESVMSRLDLIRQESDSLEDFISTVYKTPGFKHFKGDKSFKGFLELTYDYTDQEAELVEKVNESAIDLLADEIEDAEAFDAFSDGDTVEARSTKKTWDDGVPVLKYIARAPKKSVKLPKKFKVVEDNKYGWWYLQISGVWYGIEQNDYPHGEQPFEY